ncbi:MoaF C-terminal domain-containing protein [Catenulispora pinisilvae]|uniref:MoaF C-terminal domain-containing protein n=1 Tax=Catenulispora pinisilvae TaxID=2705253 RepID=UPI0018927FDA|nr:MoaF C-terminal domain-containing protein [Catenulispora pinisilvae]
MTTYEQDYVASDLWPTLNVLDNSGFAAYNIPEIPVLDGRTLTLRLDSAGEVSVRFVGGGQVELREGSATSVHHASVKEVDPGLFLVHFVRADDEKRAVVLVLDLSAGVATVVRSSIVTGSAKGGLFAAEEVVGGVINGAAELAERHQRTAELVGRRVQYVYGPDNAYEHIYLHENAYAWHCLAGAEKGLADVDRARVWKIREDIYLLTWQEKVVPCDGIVILNFRTNQSTGRIWGYDTDAGTTNAIAMGARAIMLNHTAHDPATWTA